jgi:hypothetical protein
MPLVHIDPRFLDKVWVEVGPVLAEAVATNKGEHTLDQLRAEIAYGGSHLLVYQVGETVKGAATISFKQYPNYRTAWVSYMAGHDTADALPLLKQWAAEHGASHLECLCGAGQAKLFEQRGFTEAYRLMRCGL